MLQEIERSLRSVRVQAGKARSYQALVGEQREKRVLLMLRQRSDAVERVRLAREARTGAERVRNEAGAALEAAETALRSAEEAFESIRAEREAARAELLTREGERMVALERLENARARFVSLEVRIAEASDRAAAEAARQAARAIEVKTAIEACAAAEAAVREAAVREQEANGRLEDVESAIREIEAAAAEARRHAFEAAESAARAASDESAARTEEQTHESRLRRFRERQEEVEKRAARHQADLEHMAARIRAHAESLGILEGDWKEHSEMEAAVQASRSQIAEAHRKMSEQRAALSSRLEILEDLERRHEGIAAGARAILDRGSDRIEGIVGILAERIDARFEDARAVEALLGEFVSALVVRESSAACAAAAFLHESNEGRALMLPLDRFGPGAEAPAAMPAGTRRALDSVTAPPELAGVLARLLGCAALAPSLETALALAAASPPGWAFATPDGEVVRSDGCALVGGTGVEGPLTRRMEIRRLQSVIGEVGAEMDRLSDDLSEHERKAAWIEAEKKQLRTRIYDENVLKQEAEGARKATEAALIAARDEERIHRSEIEEAERGLGEARQRREAADAARKSHDAERAAGEAAIAEALLRREALGAERAAAVSELTFARTVLTRAQADAESAEARVATARRAEEEGALVLGTLRSDADRARAERETSASEIEQAGGVVATLERSIGETSERLARLETGEGGARTAREAADASARTAREDLQSAEAVRAGAVAEEAGREGELKGLEERAREELDSDLESVAAARPAGEEMPPESELKSALETLKRKIEHMGQVNLNAIAEQEELEARHTSLSAQEQDVLKAKADLEAMIEEINRVSRDRFATTFAAVRENFQEVFRKLFGGGKADILLEEGKDVLEAGIEIVARPPGKDLRTISLLSGGEKTLTTLALLFAVFRTRPFPFTVLDEVDAALDESNIDRFIGMLKEFSKTSQFIIITHSKKTMASADVLYGITMPEAGVSKKVEVRIEEVERVLEEVPAASR